MIENNPKTFWLTGLSGSGKSTLAFALEARLRSLKTACYVLDGDKVRQGLTSDLGFSAADRSENIRRVAEIAKMMNEAGLIVIAAFISPDQIDRETARAIIGEQHFLEIHLAASIEVCEQRDPKGLYQRARAGIIPNFTGVSAPYDLPLAPKLSIDSATTSVVRSVDIVMQYLQTVRSGSAASESL